MNKILYIILISLFSLTVISCSSSDSKTTTSSPLYISVGDNGTILTSSDGTTWTSRTSGTTNNLYGVTATTTTLLAPSSLTATGAAGQVTLDWPAVSSARGYTVYWDNATGVSSSSTAIVPSLITSPTIASIMERPIFTRLPRSILQAR